MTLDEESVTVVTLEGLQISFTYPSEGNIFVLTQDYLSQASLYMALYGNNAMEVANRFIENGMHLNIFDYDNSLDLYLYVESASWATLFPNSSALSTEEAEYLMAYMKENGFSIADQAMFGTVGGNAYFFFDCTSQNGMTILLTSVGGYSIWIRYNTASTSDVTRGLELLKTLKVTSIN